MKREYVRPMMVGERFLPNEYVAACGDSGVVYKFECNAGDSDGKYAVYTYNGGQKEYLTIGNGWWKKTMNGILYSYHPCGVTHEAESNSGFLTGYYIDNMKTPDVDENIPVTIWTDNNTDVHCTTNLDMSTWETAKS